jgi:hypothetical protein
VSRMERKSSKMRDIGAAVLANICDHRINTTKLYGKQLALVSAIGMIMSDTAHGIVPLLAISLNFYCQPVILGAL